MTLNNKLKKHDKLRKKLPMIGLFCLGETSFFINKKPDKSQFPVGMFTVFFTWRKHPIPEVFLSSINLLYIKKLKKNKYKIL